MNKSEELSIIYHDIFDYPLTDKELFKWTSGKDVRKEGERQRAERVVKINRVKVKGKNYYFLDRRRSIVSVRLKREIFSRLKLKLTRKFVKILLLISSIKMVALTGSLAMNNAKKNADIDLMIITQKGTLWITRFLSLMILMKFIRRFGERVEKDKLCLNMWFSENNLVWPKRKRNIYSAHEIAQIIPLVNKNETYEKFIWENRWIKKYWPNAVKIKRSNSKNQNNNLKFKIFDRLFYVLLRIIEPFARTLQYLYMRKRITYETVTPERAIFHPRDMSKIVDEKLRVYFN